MNTTTSPITTGKPRQTKWKSPGGSDTVSDTRTLTLTPAALASWEAGLKKRDELCLAVAGTRRGKLTLYAGPDSHSTGPVAVLTGLDTETYVSRPWTEDIEGWITSILHSVETLKWAPGQETD
jgi:hypothetical protein